MPRATDNKKSGKAASIRTAGSPRTRVKRRPKEVRAKILNAAALAFTKDGFKGARMRSIAADAGVTIQLLVYHFKNKDNLWKMVMEDILKRYSKFSEKPDADQPETAAAQLRNLIADIVHYTATEPELHRIMIQEASQLSPRLVWLIENFTKNSYATFTTLVEKAQEEGAIRPDADPGRLRFAVQAMAAVPFSVPAEYEYLTGRSPFTSNEVEKTISTICQMIFVD